jgi:hypothetical protein
MLRPVDQSHTMHSSSDTVVNIFANFPVFVTAHLSIIERIVETFCSQFRSLNARSYGIESKQEYMLRNCKFGHVKQKWHLCIHG